MTVFVDAMNVVGSRPDGWWRDRHGAIVRLVAALETWAATEDEDVVVVLEQPPRPPIASTVVEVAHAPRPGRDSGDSEIVRRVRAADGPVRVVTSDRALADLVRAAGATVVTSKGFRAQLRF